MKMKLVAALLATVPLVLVAVVSCDRRENRLVMHSVAMDAPPKAKFGFSEALSQSAPLARSAAMDAADVASEAAAAVVSYDRTETRQSAGVSPTAITPGLPKIAYSYEYGYRIAADRISPLQRSHADMCERQGPRACRILSLSQSGQEGDYAEATLELAVAAPRARAFGADLAKAAASAGGSEIATSISGEDLSKQIVDTEARLRARSLLRDRLMEVLATRRGTVAELVEAERGVAQVNEEIDEARSWLNEMQGRVEFSRMTIHYSAGAPAEGGFLAPIRAVINSIGAILGMTLAALLALATALVPIGLLAWAILRGRRAWIMRKGSSGDEENAAA